MSMEEGKSMSGSGEGGGNCGGRRLGSPPAATVAGQGSGSGRPGDAEGGGGPAARLGSLASPRGGDDRGSYEFFLPSFLYFLCSHFLFVIQGKSFTNLFLLLRSSTWLLGVRITASIHMV